MSYHLLSRRVRASIGYDMTLADWICHGWYMSTDRRYRASVRALKVALVRPENDPDLKGATRDLRRAER